MNDENLRAMIVPDPVLVHRIASQDREAFEQFYDRFAARAFGLILRIVRNRTDAEDVLQETFLQVWKQASRFDSSRSAPDVWVFLIARSRALDRLRKRSLTMMDRVAEPHHDPDPTDALTRGESGQLLQSVLLTLPPEQREPILLAFFSGLTHEQIASQSRVPLGTVKTRIRLGMIRLRERMNQQDLAQGQST